MDERGGRPPPARAPGRRGGRGAHVSRSSEGWLSARSPPVRLSVTRFLTSGQVGRLDCAVTVTQM
ncbi:hypothetical protein A3L22_30020 [Streptomyces griseus subsp. griseus]|nr:hypothetical protein A3L22_30020 [Streptomyces griseus subsp. griseus]